MADLETKVKDLALYENAEIDELMTVYPKQAIDKLRAHKGDLKELSSVFKAITGAAVQNSIIMTCNPYKCPYKDSCILVQHDIAPEGFKCPIERKIVSEMECDLITDLEIDRLDRIEMELLWDLIDSKILDMRASAALQDGTVTQELITESKLGRSVKIEINSALTVKIELKKLKHDIMDEFLATRKSKKRYNVGDTGGAMEALFKAAAAQNLQEVK